MRDESSLSDCSPPRMEALLQWLESHMLPCLYHQWWGIECPFCGSQRALLALMRGQVVESLLLFPPGPLMLATAGAAIVAYGRPSARHSRLLRTLLWVDAALLIGFCLLKNLRNTLG